MYVYDDSCKLTCYIYVRISGIEICSQQKLDASEQFSGQFLLALERTHVRFPFDISLRRVWFSMQFRQNNNKIIRHRKYVSSQNIPIKKHFEKKSRSSLHMEKNRRKL